MKDHVQRLWRNFEVEVRGVVDIGVLLEASGIPPLHRPRLVNQAQLTFSPRAYPRDCSGAPLDPQILRGMWRANWLQGGTPEEISKALYDVAIGVDLFLAYFK